MKKAVVVGGSNGIGLAICIELIRNGYFVEIADLVAPDEKELGCGSESYRYSFTNLLNFDESLFRRLAKDADVESLVITAGIGRIADFEFHHIAEIDKTLTIDTVSTIKTIRIFYDRIKSSKVFYTAVMGSIAGWMSSPSASVYAAAKAGVIRLIESVNIELEMSGYSNRILDVSPSSFRGSKFYGGKNDTSLMTGLAAEIYRQMISRETRYIPQYEKVFKGVLERYYNDPHEYGIHSYHYKERSGRKDNNERVKVGHIRGTFIPFDSNQINLLKNAKNECDYLVVEVIANGKENLGDNRVKLDEIKQLLSACRYVDQVIVI